MNYINTQTLAQLSEHEIRALNPNTSFPSPFGTPEGYAYIFPSPQPSYDPVTQRVQAATPELTGLGHWEQRWSVVELFETQEEENAALAAQLSALKATALSQIDADTDAINNAVIGSRAQEYELAEKHAQEYKGAGYTGPVPSSVQSWAAAKAWTETQSADDILSTAAQWRTAQAAIRAQRLLRKEQVRTATVAAGITAATAAWDGFVTAIRGQLGA